MVTARRMFDVKMNETTHQLELAQSSEAKVAAELASKEMERSAAMEEAASPGRPVRQFRQSVFLASKPKPSGVVSVVGRLVC